MENKPVITIGIPCYQGVPAETLQDYMRFAYYLGRRYQDYDFCLAIKSKSEQFRARIAIAEAAIQVNSTYLLMLDDDHIIDIEDRMGPSDRYDFLRRLIAHMEAVPDLGLVGALYYQRGGNCGPVLMKQGENGGYYFMRDDEITGTYQEVDVQGGGCMLIRCDALLKIPQPWFEPEFDLGTDIQICKKMQESGYKVACDTGIELGHVLNSREIITSRNRYRHSSETMAKSAPQEGMDTKWALESALTLYRQDAEEYLGVDMDTMSKLFEEYNEKHLPRFAEFENPREYYAQLGPEQLARQVVYHHTDHPVQVMDAVLNSINFAVPGRGLDIGCGSAPVGFECVMRGHSMDFVDVDGAPAYEFLKWRSQKRGMTNRCGWEPGHIGDYDYVLLLDSLEHMPHWQATLELAVNGLREGGAIFTNFFLNQDTENPEHVFMDKKAAKDFLVTRGVYPLNQICWVRRDLEEARKVKNGTDS